MSEFKAGMEAKKGDVFGAAGAVASDTVMRNIDTGGLEATKSRVS